MGQAIPHQHPAVVFRSRYRQLRALLALGLVALAGLGLALVIVANDDESTTTSSASPVQSIQYGDFNPQTGRPMANVATPDVAVNPQTGAPIGTADVAVNPQTATPMENVATPDESRIAAAISGAQPAGELSGPGGPDEANVASSIGNGTAEPSVSQAHPGARP